MTDSELREIFERFNREHFRGELVLPVIKWNSRLRTSAGRFIPGSRKFFIAKQPVIEIASYLLQEPRGPELIADTLGHEMIHFWLWSKRRPYGHTPEFWDKMQKMGVSRYNPVPKRGSFKYLYKCPACQREFPARKKLGSLACAACCKKFTGGRYDPRFKLVLQCDLIGTKNQ